MARPSLVAPNVGLVEYNGKVRKALAIWNGTRFLLRLLNHGRPGSVLAEAGTIRALKTKVSSFRLVQN